MKRMLKRMKNISTGFFVFVGMSVSGFAAGIMVQVMTRTESLAPIIAIWAIASLVGLMRFTAFAGSSKDTP